ncbi:hypothetical protein [Limosilactobacillus sp.]|jgi:hypothetical protein|uniref:hypothetical protein n=1 Tax=Limosilactobacillus sp. TaxID=2773925 RepID=UPI0025C6235E|nr:hypothetical protein [Limosilactobacillus sp.]MCH3922275.1 hypothetical protein [Limosilactobacillus sp.]MCH3929047.1 hypothetical protein [Limosilactobacillus sp.]
MNDDAKLQKNKTLILTQTNPEVDVMFKSWLEYNLHADVIFKNVSKPLRALRRIVAMKMPARFLSCWLNNWKTELNNYNTIIIHASELTNHLPEYIHRINPQIRIIYWYWNPVNNHTLPRLVTDSNVEFWTFDKGDKKKYHMKFNIQYYTGTTNIQKENVKYDVYFIGHDKGRKKKINDILKKIKNAGLKYKVDILSDNSKRHIAYNIVKKRIMAAKAILEVNQKGQTGYTLRALESLFLEKKLITTNKSIVNENFYSSKNIFVVDSDDWGKLPSIITSPYDKTVNHFKNKYDINAWFSNFFD